MRRSFCSFTFLFFALNGCAQTPVKPQPQGTVAVVAGNPIDEKELAPLIQGQLRRLRSEEYDIKSQALDGLINQKLAQAEAAKRGVPMEKLLQEEVDAKVAQVSDKEIEAYYLGQKDRINRPLDQVKEQIRQGLQNAKAQQARQDYYAGLRQKTPVQILLSPPRVEVAFDAARVRGNPKAPVTIVEFSDFQCPFCTRVNGTLLELLVKYKDRINLAYLDFPLDPIHPRAHKAAEASRCALDQGKFWEYHDLLFIDASKLDDAGLAGHARTLGLDGKRFDSCLSEGKFKAAVDKDAAAGAQMGVEGTPGFFINGVFLNGAQPASAFEKIIDSELAALTRK